MSGRERNKANPHNSENNILNSHGNILTFEYIRHFIVISDMI